MKKSCHSSLNYKSVQKSIHNKSTHKSRHKSVHKSIQNSMHKLRRKSKHKFNVNDNSTSKCPVCQDHMNFISNRNSNTKSRLKQHVLPCFHMLHKKCFIDLVKYGFNKCPVCNYAFDIDLNEDMYQHEDIYQNEEDPDFVPSVHLKMFISRNRNMMMKNRMQTRSYRNNVEEKNQVISFLLFFFSFHFCFSFYFLFSFYCMNISNRQLKVRQQI